MLSYIYLQVFASSVFYIAQKIFVIWTSKDSYNEDHVFILQIYSLHEPNQSQVLFEQKSSYNTKHFIWS